MDLFLVSFCSSISIIKEFWSTLWQIKKYFKSSPEEIAFIRIKSHGDRFVGNEDKKFIETSALYNFLVSEEIVDSNKYTIENGYLYFTDSFVNILFSDGFPFSESDLLPYVFYRVNVHVDTVVPYNLRTLYIRVLGVFTSEVHD